MTFDKYSKHRLCDLYQRHKVNSYKQMSILNVCVLSTCLFAHSRGIQSSDSTCSRDHSYKPVFSMFNIGLAAHFLSALEKQSGTTDPPLTHFDNEQLSTLWTCDTPFHHHHHYHLIYLKPRKMHWGRTLIFNGAEVQTIQTIQ